jgi:DNA segregation ATPase FtsK/SpoIIIE, S-DNA-T family
MTTTTTPTSPATGDNRAGSLVHRPVRAYPRPLPVTELAVAAPPTVGWTASGAAGWLQHLVPLLGGGGSVAFLLAVPGPRSGWLVALVVGAAVASVAAGLGLRLVERRAARRARRRERARYLAHLEQVTFQADRLAAAQLAVAEPLHPDLPTRWTTVDRTDRLWERRTGDSDFLTVRVGRGPVPLAAPARLDTAAGPLLDYDPELLQAAEDLVRRATWLLGAPVVVPLRQHAVVALTGPPAGARALARSIALRTRRLPRPDDLRVLAVHPPTAGPVWAWMQHLPHARDPTAATGPTAASLPAAARTRPGDRPHLVAIVDATEGGPGAGPSGSPQRTSAPGRSVRGATVEELLEPSASDNVTRIHWGQVPPFRAGFALLVRAGAAGGGRP